MVLSFSLKKKVLLPALNQPHLHQLAEDGGLAPLVVRGHGGIGGVVFELPAKIGFFGRGPGDVFLGFASNDTIFLKASVGLI